MIKNKFMILLVSSFCVFLCCVLLSSIPVNSNPTWIGLPAFNGGYHPADIIQEPWGHCYDIYFRHSDWTRRSKEGRPLETAWTIVPGHEGYVDLEIAKVISAADANYVSIDDWKDPTGGKSGISWQYTKHSYTPGQIVPFGFSSASSAPQGVYTVYMTLYKEYSGLIDIIYSKFKVYFVIRAGADTPAPKIEVTWSSIPSSIMYGQEISIKFYLKNKGTEGARTPNWDWWGNGLQIYLENGEFTRAPKLTGYFPSPDSWGAYDYNDPRGRDVVGAPIIEVYDDFIGETETDTIEVYIRAKVASGNLKIKIQAWMCESDERLWDHGSEGALLYRYSPGATSWPFNGEWGGSPRFDDTAASSTPIAQITIVSPKITVDPNGGRIYVDGNAITSKTTYTWAYGSAHTLDPDSGYSPRSGEKLIFKKWREDGSTADPRTIVVSGNATYTAEWKQQFYLTMNVNPSGAGTVSPGSGWFDAGSSVQISATPSSGYVFSGWTGSGSGSYTGTANPATITMNGPITQTANFAQPFDFSISVSPSSGSTQQGGSVTATVTVTLVSGSTQTVSLSASGLPSGTSVTFNPSSGKPTFTSTVAILTSSSTPTGTYTITITGSGGGLSKTTTYTLEISPITYTVSFYVKDDANNVVTGAAIYFDGSSYKNGESATVTSGSYSLSSGNIPSGYRFKQWESSGGVSVSSSTSSSTTVIVSGGGLITMRLQRIATVTFLVSGLGPDVSGTVLMVDGAGYSYRDLPKSFTWDVGSTHSFAWSDYMSAGSLQQYVWISTSGLTTARTGTIMVPSGGGAVSALYKTQYYLTVSSAYGSPAPGSGWFDAGTSITASITSPISGGSGIQYVCIGWTGTGSVPASGTSTSVTFIINAPSSITWRWKTQYYLTMQVNPTGGGDLSPSSGWYDSGLSVLILAKASRGYVFSHWNLDGWNVGPSNPYTITVDAPHVLTANFAKVQRTVNTINAGNHSFDVVIESNSIVSNIILNINDKKLSFNIEGSQGTAGVCNVTIPKELLNAAPTEWIVRIDGSTPTNLTITWNTTHTFIHFTYIHSTHMVEIIGKCVVPEFTSTTLILAMILLTTLIIAITRRRNRNLKLKNQIF